MKQLIIKSRRSGKTTWLLEQVSNTTKWPCTYICINKQEENRINYLYKNPIDLRTIERFVDRMSIHNFNKNHIFLLDEYFLYPQKEREYITKYLIDNNCNFIAIGTSDKLYDKNKLDSIRNWRTLKEDQNDSLNRYNILKNYSQMIDDFGSDYFYNLLSYPEVEALSDFENKRIYYNEEQYKTEILGEYLK